jgi:glycerophosphoryl diester phosphodiesterase
VNCQRIGHGGASALAPANTLEGFDVAHELGVDMVEFDVRACRGRLVLAHTVLHARKPDNVRLDEALAHLSSRRFGDLGLNVDVKHCGCEQALLDGLRRFGLLDRALISSQVPAVLDRTRALEPRVRVGISVGGRAARFSRRWKDWRAQVLAGLAVRRWDALMAQHRLVDERLLEEVTSGTGLLYAWTVNHGATIDRLRRLGVHGIATADPRLFNHAIGAADPRPLAGGIATADRRRLAPGIAAGIATADPRRLGRGIANGIATVDPHSVAPGIAAADPRPLG